MALVNYSSSSDSESDDKPSKPKIRKTSERLPLPSIISCMNKVIHPPPINDPTKHEGRIRSFEHERGNWSSLVYIKVELSIIDDIHNMIKHFYNDLGFSGCLKHSENIHISLTKTLVLRHHWIKSFVESIQQALASSEHFPIDFDVLNVYTNEDKTRTFIGIAVSDIYFEKLHKIMLKMDGVMNEFRLETFYENPSFHASILWCVGDFEKPLRDKLNELNARFSEMRELNKDDYRINVNEIYCKTGNKNYVIRLK